LKADGDVILNSLAKKSKPGGEMKDRFSNHKPLAQHISVVLTILTILLLVMSCGRFIPQRGLTSNVNTNASNTDAVNNSSTNFDSGKYSELLARKKEFIQMTPPVKIDPKAVIKGKVIVVSQGLESSTDDSMLSRGLADYRLAKSIDELETIIQVVCSKGGQVAVYKGKDDRKATGFTSNCKVSIIDYKTPAVIAQKNFSNSKPPEVIRSIEPDAKDEYLMPRPLADIIRYIDSFKVDKEIRSDYPLSAKELLRVPLQVSIDPAPVIKGKVMFAQRVEYGNINPFNPTTTDYSDLGVNYGFGYEKLATRSSDVTTLVNIVCAKGSQIGKVGNVTEFSSKCEISLVDYKTMTVFAQKTIENKNLEQGAPKESFPTDWVVKQPKDEITAYLQGLPVS